MDYYPIMLAFSMDGLVKYAAWIGGGILAIFLIYAIVKDGIAYAKGGGKVLFLLLCLGLIFIVTKYTSIGDKAKDIAGKGIEIIGQQAETIANGGA